MRNRKSIFRSFYFYIGLFFLFTVFMAVRQEINDRETYYTEVSIIYQDGTRDKYQHHGRPNVSLSEGELMVGGQIVKSYVKSFEWDVYLLKNKK